MVLVDGDGRLIWGWLLFDLGGIVIMIWCLWGELGIVDLEGNTTEKEDFGEESCC